MSRRHALISTGVLIIALMPQIIFLHAHTGQWTLSTKTRINYDLGIPISYGTPWPEVARLASDNTRIDYSVFKEIPRQATSRYLRNAMREANEVRGMLGMFLSACLILGLPMELYRGNVTIVRALPIFAALGLPLIFLPAFYIEPRYVLMGILPLLMAACWQLMSRFRLSTSIERGVARLAWAIPVALILALSLLPTDMSVARLRPQPQLSRSIAPWLMEKAPPGSTVVAFNPQIAYFAGHKWFQLPYEPLNRVISYARVNNAEYVVLRSDHLMHPDLIKLAKGELHTPALKEAGRWTGKRGEWVVVYEVAQGDAKKARTFRAL